MNETIIKELFSFLQESRWKWTIMILIFVTSIGFSIWLSFPDKVKEYYLGFGNEEETQPNPRGAYPKTNSLTPTDSIITEEDVFDGLLPSQIHNQVEYFIKLEELEKAIPLLSNLPTSEKDDELSRIFDKSLSKKDYELAKLVIKNFDQKIKKDEATEKLKMELIKQ